MKASVAVNGPLKRGDQILDKYEVRGLLGKGGHAFVYDCFNAFLAEEVAIKLIPNLEHRGDRLLKRARGEAQVLYRLNHPNVVRVMDGGEFNGMAYIVMEKLNGISLRQMLRKRASLPVIEALLIALQVAEALEAAHAMNVIHRDLKPDNIFLLAENHVKVLDFGIAKFLEGSDPTTQRDLIQGTAPYMSPEQAQGLGVTFASDIFQLGTVLYEMIAGVCPCMVGVEDVTLQELVAIQISKLPPRLKLLVRGVPDYVDRLVWRAIAKQAHQRFTTMPELTAAIRNALERLDVDLPRERLQRAAAVRRSSSRPAAPEVPAESGVVKTPPIALSAATSAPGHTEPLPAGPPPSVPPRVRSNVVSLEENPSHAEPRARVPPSSLRKAPSQPAIKAQAPRVVLTRAMLIGALAAVPVGLAFGLIRRRQSAPVVATVATVARPASPMSAAVAPIAASVAALPPITASSQPAMPSLVAAPPPGAPHPTVIATKATAKSSRPVQAASGLDQGAPLSTATSVTRHVAPKPIF
ncbi:MAG TPA: protein kinase [Polyangiaceae bacterium]|jgi:serine/threonine-protein kinase